MSATALGDAETKFIIDGVLADTRCDGRARLDYRPVTITTDVSPGAHGSARVELSGTLVIAAVKAEVGAVDPSTPDVGVVHGISSSSVDVSSLVILPGVCWHIWVDVVVLSESGGAVQDASALATLGALYNTKLPNLVVEEDDFEVGVGEMSLPMLESASVEVSMSKIGSRWVVDCTPDEVLCSTVQLFIRIDRSGGVRGLHKALDGSLSPSALSEVFVAAAVVAKARFDTLLKCLQM